MRPRLTTAALTVVALVATAPPAWAHEHETDRIDRAFNQVVCLVSAVESVFVDPTAVWTNAKTCIKG